MGRPLASRVTVTWGARWRMASARYSAVASPVVVAFVATTTSRTPFDSTRERSSAMCRSSGSTPSIGDSAPPRTW
jgi:hypothetical protein